MLDWQTSGRWKQAKMASRLQGWIEQMLPNWIHRRHATVGAQMLDPRISPLFEKRSATKEFFEAMDSGWLPKNQRIIDMEMRER